MNTLRLRPILVETLTLRITLIAIAMIAFECACGGVVSQPAPALEPSHAPETLDLHRPHRTTLFNDLNGQRWPAPLARVSVAGHDAWVVIDSGASRHILGNWLAREAGLVLEPRERGLIDAAGRRVTTFLARDPQIAIAGWGELSDDSIVTIDLNPGAQSIRLGGYLSPQRLSSSSEAIVLDLDRGEMHSATPTAAQAEIAARGVSFADRIMGCPTSVAEGITFVVSATIEGQSARLEVDSGSPMSLIFATSQPGQVLASRSTPIEWGPYTTSGARFDRSIRAAHIRVGDVAATGNVALAPEPSIAGCPIDGLLGEDILRYCVLVFEGDRFSGRCQVP